MNKVILGICGKAQSGKDSLANFICKMTPSCSSVKLSFAKALKDFVKKEFHILPRHLWGNNEQKNYPILTWGEMFTDICLDKYNMSSVSLLSGRQILQILGTDVMRKNKLNFLQKKYRDSVEKFLQEHFGKIMGFDKIWVELLKKDLEKHKVDIVLIPDVRFINEFQMLKENGGKLVKLYRNFKNKEQINHESESEIDQINDEDFNYVLYEESNKSLKELKNFATRIILDLGMLETGEAL